MKRELGIARCGLACCLCSENEHCRGCNSGDCPDKEWCENRSCSINMNIDNCFLCEMECETHKSADVYYQSLEFDTTNQALSIHINFSSSQTRVDVNQETTESKNTEILKFH